MNEVHLELCASAEWAAFAENELLPWVLGDHALGDDLLEVGPGPGRTTDVLRKKVKRLTALEIDPPLAEALATRLAGTNVKVVQGDGTALPFEEDRFSGAAILTMLHHVPSAELQDRLLAELYRVLRPGGVLLGSDGIESPWMREIHQDDTFVPVDPERFAARLARAGFTAPLVERGDERFRFACVK
jgi:SAM-dependent methyltransferase